MILLLSILPLFTLVCILAYVLPDLMKPKKKKINVRKMKSPRGISKPRSMRSKYRLLNYD